MKILLRVLIAVFVLIIIAATLAAWLLSRDANAYKPQLRELIKAQSGLDTQIGNLNWQLFPQLVLRAEQFSAGFPQQKTLATVEALDFEVRLWPLLQLEPELQISGVQVIGADVSLIASDELPTGNNWTAPVISSDAQNPAPSDEASANDATASPASIVIEHILLERVALHYVDLDAGTQAEIDIEELNASNVALEQPVDVSGKLTATYTAAAATANTAAQSYSIKTDIATTVSVSTARLTMPELALSGTASIEPGSSPIPYALLIEDTDFNLDTQELKITSVLLDIEELDVQGSLAGTLADTPRLTGTLAAQTSHAAATLSRFMDASGLPVPTRANLACDLTLTTARIACDAHELQLDDSKGNGALTLNLPRDDTALLTEFSVALDRLNTTSLSWIAPGIAAKESQPGQKADPGGESNSAAEPEAKTVAERSEDNTNAKAVKGEPLLPLDTLAETFWQGTINIGEVVHEGITLTNLQVATQNTDGVLRNRIATGVLGGSVLVDTAASYTEKAKTVSWDITANTRNIDGATIVAQWMPDWNFEGKLTADAALKATGNTTSTLTDTLSGTISLDGGNGKLDISGIKRQATAIAALAGRGDKVGWPDVLDYTKLIGNLDLNGLSDQRFDFALDNLNIRGTGAYLLAANAVDYDVELIFEDDPQYHSFDVNEYLVGLPWPVHCKGPLDAQRLCAPAPDAAQRVLAQALKQQGNSKAREKLEQTIEEKVPEQFRDAARTFLDLLGNSLNE